MTDLSQEVPATEPTEDVVLPATGGGKGEIAGQIKDALGGEGNLSTHDKSPHNTMRRQIESALAAETDKPAEPVAKPVVERARGTDGRFIPTAQEAAAGIDPNAQPAEGGQPEAALLSGPPLSWSKDMQARWGELPPDFQAIIQKREADVAKGFEKYQNLRAVEPVLDFAETTAKQFGTSGPQLVHQWAQIQEAMLDPAKRGQVLGAIAQMYGVEHASPEVMGFAAQVAPKFNTTPANLINQWARAQDALINPATRAQAYEFLQKHYPLDGSQPQTQPDPNAWVDPDVAALKQQLAQLTGHITAQQQREQQFYQQQAQQAQQAKMSAIDQFASEKGNDGQPLRPHLAMVMPDMAAGIARLKSANPQISDQEALQQAYDNAVWGNPATREAAMQATKIAEDRERAAKARERAQAAVRGAVSVPGSSPQGPPASTLPKGDIRSQMAAAFNQIAS